VDCHPSRVNGPDQTQSKPQYPGRDIYIETLEFWRRLKRSHAVYLKSTLLFVSRFLIQFLAHMTAIECGVAFSMDIQCLILQLFSLMNPFYQIFIMIVSSI
jgi:hypothetical protein